MINKIKYYRYIILTAIFVSLVFTSCEKDSATGGTPTITDVTSYDQTTSPPTYNVGKGYPGDEVKIEGTGLSNVKSVVFDGIINVVFNTALNSDKSIFISVPFDVLKGSRFGLQKVTITKEDGKIVEFDFEITQPKPIIDDKFVPSLPKVGTLVTVNGSWLLGMSSVTFGGVSVPFTSISSKSFTFVVPSNSTAGGDVIVTTPGGVAKRFLDIDLGFIIVKVTDFDGGGLRPNKNWIKYGDANTLTYPTTGGVSSVYSELTWIGATANGYNGCQSDGGGAFMTATDPAKVLYQIDVNCSTAVGTVVDFLVTYDGPSGGGSNNWVKRFKITTTGWQPLEFKLSDFGYNYDPSSLVTKVNPSKIDQVKISIAQGAGTVNPSKVQFDNIRFKILP
jgi:Surface glycan-binding protein B xyloglucan binding domain